MAREYPIPLRPDPDAFKQADRISLVRAATAIVLGHSDVDRSGEVLKTWPDDAVAGRILKAAQRPTASGDFPQLQTMRVLPSLAPQAASTRLLALATSVNLNGAGTVRLPFIGATGTPRPPFVAEGAPAPVVDLNVSATILGPVKKLLIMCALTRETEDASADTAQMVIGNALATATEQTMDVAMFGTAAGDAVTPPGLLHGIAEIPSAATKGSQGVADDLALLAQAIAANGINSDEMVIVTTAALATKIRVLASLKFNNVVLSSSALADGTVIGIIPQGLATGFSGAASIEIGTASAVHFEDAAPADISGPGGLATPVKSAFQSDFLVLKVRGEVAWAIHSGAIAQVTGAAW